MEIYKNSNGLQQYGHPVVTDYSNIVDIYESSAASGPHCWLAIRESEEFGEPVVHLTVEQAIEIRDRLDAFIQEAPKRWGGSNPERLAFNGREISNFETGEVIKSKNWDEN